MAYSIKRGNSYQLRVSYGFNENGTHKLYTRTWKPKEGLTKKQIEKELINQLEQFEEDVKKSRKLTGYSTFSELSCYWMENEAKNLLAPKTYDRYKSLLERVNESNIGRSRLIDIDPQDLNMFYKYLASPGINKHTGGSLSPKTIREHHNIISKVLDVAWKWGIVEENIARRATPPSKGYTEIECLNKEEVENVFILLENEPIQYRTMITLLIMLGCRRGELCGLEWNDIDFDKMVVHIRRASQYVNKQIITKEPKTKNSIRLISLDPYSSELLKEYKKWQDEKISKAGTLWNYTDRLFTKYDGTPIHPDTIGDWWDKFQERNELKKHTLHSLRHTNASLLISCNTDVVTVAGRLGHANSSTTLKVYSHMFEARDKMAANAMAKIVEDFNRI